jgi:hypothetical protein
MESKSVKITQHSAFESRTLSDRITSKSSSHQSPRIPKTKNRSLQFS